MLLIALFKVLNTGAFTVHAYDDHAFSSVAPRLLNSLPAILGSTDDWQI